MVTIQLLRQFVEPVEWGLASPVLALGPGFGIAAVTRLGPHRADVGRRAPGASPP